MKQNAPIKLAPAGQGDAHVMSGLRTILPRDRDMGSPIVNFTRSRHNAVRIAITVLLAAALVGILGTGSASATTTTVDCGYGGNFVIVDNVVTSTGPDAGYPVVGYSTCTGTAVIPGTVTEIAANAFVGSGVSTVTIPASVRIIGDGAFLTFSTAINVNADNLDYSSDSDGVLFNKSKSQLIQYPVGSASTTYTIPGTVTTVGSAAFANAYLLQTVHIAASVVTIAKYAFQNMGALRTVDFEPSSALQTIGEAAFESSGMTSFTIPSNVTSIEGGSLANAPNLTSITVAAGNAHFSADGGVLFNGDKTAILAFPTGLTTASYSIPPGVTTVGKEAFLIWGNTTLQRITFPIGVTTLDDNVIGGAVALTGLRFEGDAPTSVNARAIAGVGLTTAIERIPRTRDWGSGTTWNNVALAYYLPAPAAPTAVAAAVSATVTIALPATGPTPDTYRIRTVEDGTKTCTITLPDVHCTVPGLTSGANYTFTATAHTSSPTVDSPASASSTAVVPTAAPDLPPDTPRATAPLKVSTQHPSPTATVVKTTFVAPGPGTVTQVGTLAPSRRDARSGAMRVCAVRKSVLRAGKVTVVCSLSRAAKRARAQHALRVLFVTTFTPPSGVVLVSTRTITLARTPAPSAKSAVIHAGSTG